MLCMWSLKDIMISASPDGILVSDKEQSSYIKPFCQYTGSPVMFAEKSWGGFTCSGYQKALRLKVTLNPGHQMNYHNLLIPERKSGTLFRHRTCRDRRRCLQCSAPVIPCQMNARRQTHHFCDAERRSLIQFGKERQCTININTICRPAF